MNPTDLIGTTSTLNFQRLRHLFEKIAKSRSSSFGGESPKSEVKKTELSNEQSRSEQSKSEQSTSEQSKSELSGTSAKSEVQQSEQDKLDNNHRPRPAFNTGRPPLPTAPKPPLLNRGSRVISAPVPVQSPTGATSVPALPK
jgi:hypothetical protein